MEPSIAMNVSLCPHATTHTHTDPFNGPFSGTTWVSRYQKNKTNLDFTEARDSEWQWHQLGHMQVCTSLQTDNHTTLFFYRPDALPAAQSTVSKHWRHATTCPKFMSFVHASYDGDSVLFWVVAILSFHFSINPLHFSVNFHPVTLTIELDI